MKSLGTDLVLLAVVAWIASGAIHLFGRAFVAWLAGPHHPGGPIPEEEAQRHQAKVVRLLFVGGLVAGVIGVLLSG